MAESFDLDGARKAGYNDTEIADYLAGSKAFDISGARSSGYNDQEIISHLTRPQPTQQSSAAEMSRVLSGQQMNQPMPTPIPQRQAPRPFYELPKPIPGTEKTGLPPVAPVRQPRVAYDAWGAMPGADERMQAMAGQPQPEAPPSLDIYGRPSSPLGDSAAVTGGRAFATGFGSTIAGTGKGVRLAGQSAGPVTKMATAAVLGSGGGLEDIGKALEVAGNAITPPGQEGDEKYSSSWWKNPSLLADPDYMAWQAGNAGGSMAAYMAPMVGALGRVTTAAGAVRGLTAASSLAESLANSAEVYDKAKQNGASDEDALAAFQSNLPKDFVFTYLTNKAGIFNERLARPVARGVVGTGLEVAQEAGQGVIGQHTLGKPLTEDLDVNALGGLLGGPVGAAMSPIGHAGQTQQQAPRPNYTEASYSSAPPQASAPQLQPIPSLDRPEVPVPPPAPQVPEAPAPLDAKTPEQLYEEAKRVAAGKTTMGTSVIAKAVGVSQDEARAMLDQMTQEGIVAPVQLKGGGTQYVNVAKKAARGGRSLVTKAPKFEEMVAPQSATQEAPREEVIQESGVAPEGSAMPPESSPLIQQRKESFNSPDDTGQIEQVRENRAGDQGSPAPIAAQPTYKESLEVQTPEQSTNEPGKLGTNVGLDSGATREGQPVHEPGRAAAEQPGRETDILIPGERDRYKARYAVRELDDVHTSHLGETFQHNPKYGEGIGLKNERDYSDPVNQERVILASSPERFEPAYLITDNPDVTNGPPAIDPQGNVLGGNSRGMILQRAYGEGRPQGQRYKQALAERAAQFGIDPARVANMKRPVLVREIGEGELARIPQGRKTVVRATNKTGTATLTRSERAMADAGQMSDDSADHIAALLETAGPDATLNDVLSTSKGPDVVLRLLKDGVFTVQEKNTLIDDKTKAVTSEAKQRVQQALVGRLFRASDQIRRMAPSVVAKLERVVGPVMRLDQNKEWSIREDVKEAMDVIESAQAHGIKNLGDLAAQQDLFGAGPTFSDRAIALAGVIRDRNPNDVSKAFKRYAANAENSDTMFGKTSAEEGFEDAFGVRPEPRKVKEIGGRTSHSSSSDEAAKAEAPAEVITPRSVADRLHDISKGDRKRIAEHLQDGEAVRDAISLGIYGAHYSDLVRSGATEAAFVRQLEKQAGVERDTRPEQIEEDEAMDARAAREIGPLVNSLKETRPAAFTKELQAKLDEDTFVPNDQEAELLDRVAKEAEQRQRELGPRAAQREARKEAARRAKSEAFDASLAASRMTPESAANIRKLFAEERTDVSYWPEAKPAFGSWKNLVEKFAEHAERGGERMSIKDFAFWGLREFNAEQERKGPTPFSAGFMGTQALAHYAGRAANALKRRAAQRQQAKPQQQHYTPHDPEVKRQMEAARVEPEDKKSLRDLWDGLKAIWTRQYKHLAPGARFAPLRVEFNRVTKAKGNSVHSAAQAIVDQIGKLNKEEYSDFLYVVALDDLAARVRQQVAEGQPVENSDLPFGLKTKADLYQARREARAVAAKNPAIVQALKLRRDMWSKIKPEYIAAMKAAGHDVAKTVSREDYFRHRVLEHLEMKNAIGNQGSGAGQRFKTPVGRGWLKKAMVNPHAYSLDYIRAEFEVLNQMMYDTARAQFISWVADPANKLNIAQDLRKQTAAHNKKAAMPAFQAMARNYNRQNPGAKSMTADSMFKRVMGSLNVGQRRLLQKKLAGSKYIGTLEKAYNEFALKTHAIYQPVEGHHFFLASALNDQMAEEIEKNGIGIVKSKEIRKIRAQGIKRPQLVLPREVIETMREFMQPPNSQFATAGEYVAKTLAAWKKLKLIHPLQAPAYNLRNASGDIWRVLEVAPRAFTFAKDSLSQIIKYKKTGRMSSPEFQAWWERGGMDSNLQVAEMGEVNKLEELEHLLVNPKAGAGRAALKVAGKAWNKVWGASRTFTDVREGILRFSMFREFQRQLKANGGRPYTFGASLREEVMALKDVDDRAYKLANDAMLAYDEVSRGGQFTRRYLIPFWSFQEQNARAYSRMVRNSVIDGRQAAAVGIVAMGGARAAAKVGAYTAVKVGQTVSMALALKTLTTLWNMAVSGDEEDDLPESVQKDTHLLFGRDENGKVRTFTRIGLIDDLLEWVGLNAAPFYVKEYLNGRMTIEEMAKEMAKAPLNKIAQGFTPMLKMPLELVSGRAVFPDVFSMRTIRDRGEYVARELGVLGLYKHLMGKPQPKMSAETIADMVIHRYDPNETHYNSFRYDLVPKWGVQHGKDKQEGGYGMSRSSAALYDVRMSLRYGDRDALVKGLEAYTAAGGTRQNLAKAIDRLHPLGSLSKADRKAFVASLEPREKAQLEQAILFWKENFDTHRRELDMEARGAGMIEKKKRTKKR